jgi:hypothetical protein
MIELNKYKDVPIVHKCGRDRVGKPMTKQEIHEFGIALLVVYLYYQKSGTLLSENDSISNEFPHLVVKNPKKELLYIWVKTEIAPALPKYIPDENHDRIIKLAKQFNAKPVFAGIILKCSSNEENSIPLCGGGYFAQFTGFKVI